MLLLTVTWISAGNSIERDNVVLQAEEIKGDDGHLYADGHILLTYAKTRFTASHAAYDKAKQLLTVYGAVHIINPDGSMVKTDAIKLYVAQEYVTFEKFLYTSREEAWIFSDHAEKRGDCYRLNQALFSTCTFVDPDWHLGFSSADYNATSRYIKLRDITFYAGNTPIFYFPYLAFSTSRERSSGLLMPRLGYSSKEGFVYEQPLYWAISQNMDIEFDPQIRTDRSLGIYSTVRFADSAYSEGLLRLGYFKDKETFASAYNLENDTHYGLEGHYESSNVLREYKPLGYQDALYANLVLFNDIDYLNLQKDKLEHLSDSHLKESRLHYLLYDERNYFGLTAKYFLDANKQSNGETLQEIPSLRWHRFASDAGVENFSYSIDTKLTHYMREEGSESTQWMLDVPMTYDLSLLDAYLHIQLGEKFSAFHAEFDADSTTEEHYSAFFATHQIKAYTDLIQIYETGTHTLQWEASYEKQHYAGDGRVDYDHLDTALREDFLIPEPLDERIALGLNQYWYAPSLDLQAKQRLSRTYYPDRGDQWGDLRHELSLHYGKWHIVNGRVLFCLQCILRTFQ